MANELNKQKLTRIVAEAHSLTQKEASSVVDTMVNAMKDSLTQGESVIIQNFGTLYVRRDAARKVNPSFGSGVAPEANRVKFRSSKALKAQVNS